MEIIYAGFWRRFTAMFIDAALTIPVALLVSFLAELLRLPYIVSGASGLAFFVWYSVYLVQKYGGTPGKLLMGVRITMKNGDAVTEKAVWIRSSVWLLMSVLAIFALTLASQKIGLSEYYELGLMDRPKKLEELAPFWYAYARVFDQLWFWSEFVTMLFNKKRRAIHDFMAGTVVIRHQKQVLNEVA